MKIETHESYEAARFSDINSHPCHLSHDLRDHTAVLGRDCSSNYIRLTQALAGELATLLKRFADTGKLAEEAQQEIVSDVEKIAFVEARGWRFNGRWFTKDCSYLSIHDAYREAKRRERPEPVPVPGYPYVEQPAAELGEIVDAEYPATAIEAAAIEWVEARIQTNQAKARLGLASDTLAHYRAALRGQPMIFSINGQDYIVTLPVANTNIHYSEVITPEQAQEVYLSEPPF